MVSKNLPVCIKNCNTSQILIFGGYVKVSESLYTRVMIWINTKLNPFDTRASLPMYEGLCMVCRPKWYRKRKDHQIPIPYCIGKYEIAQHYDVLRTLYNSYRNILASERLWCYLNMELFFVFTQMTTSTTNHHSVKSIELFVMWEMYLRYAGVIRFIFHFLQFSAIRFTQ